MSFHISLYIYLVLFVCSRCANSSLSKNFTVVQNSPALIQGSPVTVYASSSPQTSTTKKFNLSAGFYIRSSYYTYVYFQTDSALLFMSSACFGQSGCPYYSVQINTLNYVQNYISIWRTTTHMGIKYSGTNLGTGRGQAWEVVFVYSQPGTFYLNLTESSLLPEDTLGVRICNNAFCQTLKTSAQAITPGLQIKVRSCMTNCVDCEDLGNRCKACAQNFTLNTNTSSCDPICPANCFDCVNPTTCLACRGGYFLQADRSNCLACESSCMTCYNAKICTTCYAGYYLDLANSTCVTCMDNCQFCTGPTDCSACVAGTVFQKVGNSGGGLCKANQFNLMGILVIVLSACFAAAVVFFLIRFLIKKMRAAKRQTRVQAIRNREIFRPEAFLLDPSIKTTEQCSICLTVGVNTMTTCGHFFHGGCLFSWHHKKSECPNCRCQDIAAQIECENCHMMHYCLDPCSSSCGVEEWQHEQCWKKALEEKVPCKYCTEPQQIKSEEFRLPTALHMVQN